MSRRCLSFMILLVVFQTVSAADAGFEKINYAFDALYRGVFSAVASYVAIPRITLPGVTVEEESENALTYRLSFNRSDISNYSSAFQQNSSSWYVRLIQRAGNTISPLSGVAVSMLSEADYKRREVILDGVITTEISSSGNAIRNWLDVVLLRDWSSLEFSVNVSVVVSGTGVGIPLAFEGVLEGKGESDGSTITVTTRHMECNGTEIVILPMVFRAGEKENNSEDSRESSKVS